MAFFQIFQNTDLTCPNIVLYCQTEVLSCLNAILSLQTLPYYVKKWSLYLKMRY